MAANKGPDLEGLIVFTAPTGGKAAIEKLAAEHRITVPMVLPVAPIDPYRINPQAHSTLLLTKNNKVRFNAVNVTAESFAKVADAVKGVLKQ